MAAVRTVLVRREYHGQIWYDTKVIDASWTLPSGLIRGSSVHIIGNGRQTLCARHTEENKGVNDNSVQDNR